MLAGRARTHAHMLRGSDGQLRGMASAVGAARRGRKADVLEKTRGGEAAVHLPLVGVLHKHLSWWRPSGHKHDMQVE